MGPPGVVVVLVDQVLPGDQLEEEDPGADEGGDDCPAGNKEVARVVANHVAHGNSPTPKHIFKRRKLLFESSDIRSNVKKHLYPMMKISF